MEQVAWGTNTWLREGLPWATHLTEWSYQDKAIFDPVKLIRIISIIIQTYFFDIFYNFPSVCYFDFLS